MYGELNKISCKKVQVSFWKRYWTISCSPRWKGFSFSFGSWTFDFGCFWCVLHLSSRRIGCKDQPSNGCSLGSVGGLGSEVSDSSRIPSSASSLRHFSWVPWDDMMRSMRIHDDVLSST